MAKKMTKGLMALSSAAVMAVYAIGYTATAPAAVTLAAPPSTSSLSQSATALPAVSAQPQRSAPGGAGTSAATGLRDGTYTGSGWSRRGGVQVSVTIKNGRIAAAPITGVTTHYSQNVIAGLPAEVVSRQSSQIDLVSGATDSSMAYQQAVAQALSQAGGGQGSQAGAQPSIVASPPGATALPPSANNGGFSGPGPDGSFRRRRRDFQGSNGYGGFGNGSGGAHFGEGQERFDDSED